MDESKPKCSRCGNRRDLSQYSFKHNGDRIKTCDPCRDKKKRLYGEETTPAIKQYSILGNNRLYLELATVALRDVGGYLERGR